MATRPSLLVSFRDADQKISALEHELAEARAAKGVDAVLIGDYLAAVDRFHAASNSSLAETAWTAVEEARASLDSALPE